MLAGLCSRKIIHYLERFFYSARTEIDVWKAHANKETRVLLCFLMNIEKEELENYQGHPGYDKEVGDNRKKVYKQAKAIEDKRMDQPSSFTGSSVSNINEGYSKSRKLANVQGASTASNGEKGSSISNKNEGSSKFGKLANTKIKVRHL